MRLWPHGAIALALLLAVFAAYKLLSGGSGGPPPAATATRAVSGGAPTATRVIPVVAASPSASVSSSATLSATATATTAPATETARVAVALSATAAAAPTATATQSPTPEATPTITPTPPFDWSAAERAGLIAFVSGRRPDNANIPDIYVMNPDGSDQRRLLTISAADAYPSSDPAWSHDGHQLAFTSSRDGNEEVYVMNVDGSGLNNLTQTQAADNSPDWWTDNSLIVFQSIATATSRSTP